MPCPLEELRHIALFSLLDDDELKVLAAQVEMREFAALQRIYKVGEQGGRAYLTLSGAVRVILLDEDGQEVTFAEPRHGDVFGLASLLEDTPHQTTAYALEPTTCIEIDRNDLSALFETKPLAGLDMMAVLARDIHSAQGMVRGRVARSPNQVIDEEETMGERIADRVASFGGSWTFITIFVVVLVVYTAVNIALRKRAWDPYPFILLNLFLSMLAAIQAPVIMMSQNRQDSKDRVRSELDFDVNRRAEVEIQNIGRRLNLLMDQMDDLNERLRGNGDKAAG